MEARHVAVFAQPIITNQAFHGHILYSKCISVAIGSSYLHQYSSSSSIPSSITTCHLQVQKSNQRLPSTIHHPTSTKNPHKKRPKTPSKPSTKKTDRNASKTTNRMIPHCQFDFLGFPCIHSHHLIRQYIRTRKGVVRETVNDKHSPMFDIIRLLKKKNIYFILLCFHFQFGYSVILANVRSIFFDSFSSSIRLRSFFGSSSFRMHVLRFSLFSHASSRFYASLFTQHHGPHRLTTF